MAPLQSPPAAERVQMRTFRLAEAPKLQLDELFSPSMALNGFNHLFSDPSANLDKDRVSPNAQSGEFTNPNRDTSTPIRRNVSNGYRVSSPLPQDTDTSLNSPPSLSNLGTPTSELGNSPWSAAIGRATTGKSGRVIEKLMGDNDRLQREKNLAIVKLEEEVKRGESARLSLESLQVSNQNLISIHETDNSFLTKKERRIEELRADLEVERSRREKAETETRESRRERDDIVEKLRREAAEDRQQAQRSACQYEVLSKSWKNLEERYERQTSYLRTHLENLHEEIARDKRKLAQLEVILEQLRQEGDKTRKAKEQLSSNFEAYRAEQEAGIQSMRERAKKNDDANDWTQRQMQNVLGEMRYVVNVKRDRREQE